MSTPYPEITINCNYWQNPIVPDKFAPIYIITMDKNGNIIDQSSAFEIDASTYTPFIVPDLSVTYAIATKTI